MANQISGSFMAPGAFDADAEQLRRRQALADELRKQSEQMPQGQMVSGRYVAPSWTQYLANALGGVAAERENKQVLSDMQTLSDKRQGERVGTLSKYADLLTGKPAQTIQPDPQEVAQAFDTEGQAVPQPFTTQAQAPNKQAALAMLLSSRDPLIQQMGLKEMMKTPEYTLGERFNEKTGMREKVLYDKNDPTKVVPFGGQEAVRGVVVNDRLANPYSGTPIGNPMFNPAKDLINPVTNQPNAPLVAVKKDIANAGKTSVNTQVSMAGPKAFEVELGKQDAEQLGKWRTAAEAANNTLGVVQGLRAAEKQGAYSGGGANAKLAVANMINGFTGVEIQGLVGSQIYNAEASKLVLDKVKSLGANPSNADREFIERTVPQLSTSATARKQMADYMERKASEAISLYKRADAHARKNSGLGGFNMFVGGEGWSMEPAQ